MFDRLRNFAASCERGSSFNPDCEEHAERAAATVAREPWGIHRIGHIYAPNVIAGLPDGRHALAVCEPYSASAIERLRAAWWVLTGRAHAFLWPEIGELEKALREK